MKTIKKILSPAALAVGLVFTIFILISVFGTRADEKFNIVFFSGSNFIGYEQTPPAAKIEVSPALAWDHVSTSTKTLGWIFLVVMWLAIWSVDSDAVLGTKKVTDPGGTKTVIGVGIILAPLILSAIFFFASYSSQFNNNYVSVTRDRFDEWVGTGAIIKTGEDRYIDHADTLKSLFNKNFIK